MADHHDPVALLLRHAETGLPELVRSCTTGMLVSPFTFCRGLALVMLSGPSGRAR
ncbi:MAG TPA: hypothetical protein VF086_11435 [Propionibacteriaceae bacterium]